MGRVNQGLLIRDRMATDLDIVLDLLIRVDLIVASHGSSLSLSHFKGVSLFDDNFEVI